MANIRFWLLCLTTWLKQNATTPVIWLKLLLKRLGAGVAEGQMLLKLASLTVMLSEGA
jgi:hypothetical protein